MQKISLSEHESTGSRTGLVSCCVGRYILFSLDSFPAPQMDGSKVQTPLQKYSSANKGHKTNSAIDYLKIFKQRKKPNKKI
ncbi:MAG: hypothetical protein CMQ45_10575 [Gammaproteobacteria bacterium]|nr:hypothetical protein [Gammaproteobacteria bacterium]